VHRARLDAENPSTAACRESRLFRAYPDSDRKPLDDDIAAPFDADSLSPGNCRWRVVLRQIARSISASPRSLTATIWFPCVRLDS